MLMLSVPSNSPEAGVQHSMGQDPHATGQKQVGRLRRKTQLIKKTLLKPKWVLHPPLPGRRRPIEKSCPLHFAFASSWFHQGFEQSHCSTGVSANLHGTRRVSVSPRSWIILMYPKASAEARTKRDGRTLRISLILTTSGFIIFFFLYQAHQCFPTGRLPWVPERRGRHIAPCRRHLLSLPGKRLDCSQANLGGFP